MKILFLLFALSNVFDLALAGTQLKPLVRFEYKKGELIELCQKALSQSQQDLDAISKISKEQRTIENTLLAFENSNVVLSEKVLSLVFMKDITTSDQIRSESLDCYDRVGKYEVEIGTRRDLYDAIKSQVGRNRAEQRLLSETLKYFEMNGLKLNEESLSKVRVLMKKLSDLTNEYSENYNSDSSEINLSLKELEGLPTEFIDSLKKDADGNRVVVLDDTSYGRLMTLARSETTRKKAMFAYHNRATPRNVEILEEALRVRQQLAPMLGYKSWADYRMNDRMAQNVDRVVRFLKDLTPELKKKNHKYLKLLLTYKREFLEPNATEVFVWDVPYLQHHLLEKKYAVDGEKVREYLPVSVVVPGMFEIFSKLFEISISEVKGAPTWAPDVQLFEVRNRTNKKENNSLIGYFYADLYPRPNKYKHAAAFELITGHLKSDGTYATPISAIVANFSSAEGNRPALLKHSEVETLFHEFGHILHHTLTKAPYASLSGMGVKRDFVEAPSQMLEHWVWDFDILKNLSGHYKNPVQKLPRNLLKQMLAARDFDQGYRYSRQIFFAQIDLDFHTLLGELNTTSTMRALHQKIMGMEMMPNTHFQATFGHLMGGYDAGYYGYLWSEVFADDMFTKFKSKGLLNHRVGRKYREKILEQGNMQDPDVLLTNFLGRKPNNKAFLKNLGM